MPRRLAALPTLPAKEALILELLIGAGSMYGLELVAQSRRQLKRGTVYVTLGRMEEKGYISSTLEIGPPPSGGLPRRMYRLTLLGRRAREAWAVVSRKLAWENA